MDLKVCVVGIWHLGAVILACLAELGYQVIGVEKDPDRAATLSRGIPQLFEPGLEELMGKHLTSGRLRFTTDLPEGTHGTPYVIIAYDTPVSENDEPDLTPIIATVEELAGCLEDGATVVVISQVPVGTCEALAGSLSRLNPDLRFGMAYVPENLRLGQAIERFLRPDLLVFGADSDQTMAKIETLFSPIPAPRVRTDLRTAEMTKHAINAYLATCISFGNELANLCDEVGADALRAIQALRLESRVSPKAPLLPGLGFSGGTLARDIKVLKRLAEEHGYPAPLLNGVLGVNQLQNAIVINHLEKLLTTLQGKIVGVLGLTYKPDTSTLRRAAAIEIIQALNARGVRVKAYDPKVDPAEVTPFLPEFTLCDDPYAVAEGAHAIVLVTPWREFKDLNLVRLRAPMHYAVFLDTANVFDPDKVTQAGFIYKGIGRSSIPRRDVISP
jgi:UDPglucose 6-dehydrogenase